MSTPRHGSPVRHMGIVLFDGVEELDAVGPWEVLAYWTRSHPEDGYDVTCLSADGAPVTAAKGLVLGSAPVASPTPHRWRCCCTLAATPAPCRRTPTT